MKKLPSNLYKDIGCDRSMIYKINKGLRQPSPELAEKIIKVMRSKGEHVTLSDLRPDLASFIANLI